MITLSLFITFCSIIFTKLFCIIARGSKLMDYPNERSMHSTPVLRGGGGVFIALSLIAFWIICNMRHYSLNEINLLFFVIIFLALTNFIDDLYNLSAKVRFFIQSIIAVVIIYAFMPLDLNLIVFSIKNSFFIALFLFFAIIWAINLFNFMDGLDGFCASQSIYLFASYAILFHIYEVPMYEDLCWVVFASLLGFLVFNFPPAKLFMGDVGSATLGLFSFSIAIVAQKQFEIPIIYWFILNGLFFLDSTLTLTRRILNKEKWFAAHKKHAYQRIKQSGLSGKIILLVQLIINISLLTYTYFFEKMHMHPALYLSVPFSMLFLVYLFIERKKPMLST